MKDLLKNGAIVMLFSAVVFSFMALLAKIATKELHPSEIVFVRFFVTFIFISLLYLFGFRKFKIMNKKLLIPRGIFGGIATILYYASFAYIPVGRATLLTYTYPVFATVFAHFLLKERINKKTVLALITAIIGLIVISGFDVNKFLLGDILGILSGVSAGFSVTFIRKLRETESSWMILYSLGFFGSVMIAPMAITNFKFPSVNMWIILLVVGVLAIVGQIAMTYAYKFCRTSTGSIISLATVVLANLWGFLFLKDVLSLNFIIGGIMVLGSTVYMLEFKKGVKGGGC
jgi:drug/metabolite transporter (DMT)-like permease